MENISENSDKKKTSFSFKKDERLTRKKVIDKLFSEGKSFLVFPLKVVYTDAVPPTVYPVQAAFSVGKRNFKRAVDRNLIKRKMRETYRLGKSQLYKALPDKNLAIFFIYIGKNIPEYEMVRVAMDKAIRKLIVEFSSEK